MDAVRLRGVGDLGVPRPPRPRRRGPAAPPADTHRARASATSRARSSPGSPPRRAASTCASKAAASGEKCPGALSSRWAVPSPHASTAVLASALASACPSWRRSRGERRLPPRGTRRARHRPAAGATRRCRGPAAADGGGAAAPALRRDASRARRRAARRGGLADDDAAGGPWRAAGRPRPAPPTAGRRSRLAEPPATSGTRTGGPGRSGGGGEHSGQPAPADGEVATAHQGVDHAGTCSVAATSCARNTRAPCQAQTAVAASVPSSRSSGRSSASPTKSLFDSAHQHRPAGGHQLVAAGGSVPASARCSCRSRARDRSGSVPVARPARPPARPGAVVARSTSPTTSS